MLTAHEKAALLRQIEKLWEFTDLQPCETRCLDCTKFVDGFCRHWQDWIPIEAQPQGCAEWEFNPDSAPF